MKWNYKTTLLDLDTIVPPEAIQCDKGGTCSLEHLPELSLKGLEYFRTLLEKEGQREWELVQCAYHGGKLLCMWKRMVKEAFVS